MSKNNIFIITIITLAIAAILFVLPAGAVEDCMSCHDVRHGFANNTYCINCHINYTIVDGEHPYVSDSDELVYPYFIHTGFDWEGDNLNESGFAPSRESCPYCHESGMTMSVARENMRICEDCHLQDSPGPWQKDGLRSDIDDFLPIIYSHYTGAENMDVPDQSGVFGGDTISTCFGYNTETGEGTCHGVTAIDMSNTSEEEPVAHIYRMDKFRRSDPFQMDITIDHMPDSTDCMFCHLQSDPDVRLRWGNASVPDIDECNTTANSECWSCHVEGGQKPYDFHSMIKPESFALWKFGLIAGFALILLVFVISRFQKK